MARKILREYIEEKELKEGFDDVGKPDLKYYAFDWDDNILNMPTQIMVSTDEGKEVGMSTEDFAEYRGILGKEPFLYNGDNIVGYSEDPYRNFTVKGDSQFIVDSMVANEGPSWGDFVEAVNGGSIFSIITARGHTPSVLRDAVYNMIMTNHKGISKDSLMSNLKKYRDFAGEDEMTDDDMIEMYLDLLKFHPVTYGEGSASNPEEGKIKALRDFISYVKEMSSKLNQRAFFKNDVKNNFVPMIGFSDDDPGNIDSIKDFLNKEYKDDKPVKTYLTKGGEKKEV
tara:strand:- start:470 stop:1321 length:852 start_codon:yes stop_codon:yes gene_type:complete